MKIRMLVLALLCVLETATLHTRTEAAPTPMRTDIRVGAGDMLEVSVFDTPELSGKARVSEQGDISLPLIGSVHIAGLSTDQAKALIEQKLVEGNLVKEPQVSIVITEYATQGITIVGEVMKPGIYPALGGKTLLDVISMAAGLTPTAGGRVRVIHRGSDEALTFALRDAQGEMSSSTVQLSPGDTVVVPRAGIVYVLGDVGKPGGFVMDREEMSVLEALAFAQGTTKTSSMNKAKLLRKTNNGVVQSSLPLKSILSAKMADPMLQAGDIIYVPGSLPKNAMQMGVQGIISSAVAASIYIASGR